MYLAHIATFIGLALVAAGFVALHFARKGLSPQLRIAALILVIGGILGLSCILYYSLKYWQAGYFESPAAIMMPHGPNAASEPRHD